MLPHKQEGVYASGTRRVMPRDPADQRNPTLTPHSQLHPPASLWHDRGEHKQERPRCEAPEPWSVG